MKIQKRLRLAAGMMLALFAIAAFAGEQEIRQVFATKLPDARIISIVKLPYAGLYEISVQRQNGPAVFYSDASAKLLIIGSLIDTQSDRNLTDERMSKVIPMLDATARKW